MNRINTPIFGITLAGALALLATPRACQGAAISSTDTFGSGANAFTIEFVEIGNAGNADDTGAGGGSYSSPYGGVPYSYRMGVTEVRQEWITKATSLGLTNVTAGPWTGSQPATEVSWYEAAAFVNFLNASTGHQPAYQLNATATAMTLWSSAEAWQTGGENLYRHKDTRYFLPSEDEWYKAAYHKNDGVTANYWDYATGSNAIPTAVASGTIAGAVVYGGMANFPAAVDNNGGLSPYGTRGQNGNVWELQESAFVGPNNSATETRAYRGGNRILPEEVLRSSRREAIGPTFGTSSNVGFRIASVPEPGAAMLLGTGLMFLLRRRVRSFR